MIRKDDRTEEQKKTHTCLVVGTDSFLSGWGEARGGASYAAWACKPKNFQSVWRWVKNRSDMKRVRQTQDPYYPSGCAHLHIYVVNDENTEYPHPAIR